MMYLEKFHKFYPDVIKQMRDCSHHYHRPPSTKLDIDEQELILNPWHMEGDVWSHTMMVHNMTGDDELVPEKNKKVMELATLFHDVGKVYTRIPNDEKCRVKFNGHTGISSYLVLNFLNKLPVGEIMLEEYIDIFYIISLHHSYMYLLGNDFSEKQLNKLVSNFAGKPKLLELVLQHMKCDSLGRFSIGEEGYNTERWQVRDLEKRYGKQIKFTEEAELRTVDEYHKANPIVGMLVGPPSSGKSTYIKEAKLAEKYDVILSRDDIVIEFSGGNVPYNKAWDIVDHSEVDTEFELRFINAVNDKANILVDKTNMNKKSRSRILSRVSKEYFKTCYLMLTPFDTIFERNANRANKSLDPSIILRMMKSFSVPMHDEFDFITYSID